jgi:gliding motility-associated-like protein
MINRRFFLLFIGLLAFCGYNKTKAQNVPIVAIALNEYCVGNFSISDNYGYNSDWVEIYNAHTASVSLSGYYLSNDKTNLYKWQFPATYTLPVGGFGIVYLSGRNESKQSVVNGPYFHHASFNIDQCKNQWLILTTPQGVVRDSIFIQKTQAGHSRGRVNYADIGITTWSLYPIPSFSVANPNVNNYINYLPIPTLTPQAGWGHNGQTVDMFLSGSLQPYDSSDTLNCYEIHYTTNGCVPTLLSTIYTGTNSALIIVDNMMIRAATFPKSAGTTYSAQPSCYPDVTKYLPSFVETNTYFSESNGSFDNFDPRFGVMSVALDCADTSWLNSPGAYKPLAHVEYFENKQQKLEGYAELFRPINESWLTKQKGFYVTIDDRRGFGCNFEGPIFNDAGLGTTSRTVFPTLHVKAGDFESHSSPGTSTISGISYGTGIRDVFLQSLAAKYNLNVSPLHIKPLITFMNGKYMGAYGLREVYDKYYESYYSGQPKDSVILQSYYNTDAFVQNQLDGRYSDPVSVGLPNNIFRTEVVDWASTKPMNSPSFYNTLMDKMDKASFIDYMILNTYAMNSDLWNYDIAFGKGMSKGKPGDKWHYYLWNTPATFTFQALKVNNMAYTSPYTSPCAEYTTSYGPSAYGGNGLGIVMRRLMSPTYPPNGNSDFQLEYKNRYQDLLNGALRCDNILAQYDYVVSLFRKEMKYHESTSSTPLGFFTTADDLWDTNTYHLRKIIAKRCDYMKLAFGAQGCYSMYGPYAVSVDVYPPSAGTVKLNSVILPNYIWDGQYYSTQLSFKAAPTSTNYVFHHWEFKAHITKNNAPLSLDSVAIDFNQPDQVLAVFTDITEQINGGLAIPTGFSPNGDGKNDEFKPLGSALFATDYDFRIWNRWGQEVFRSTEPAKGWDGYFEGKQSQTGVYAYMITYKNVFNESKIKKGNVTLVR